MYGRLPVADIIYAADMLPIRVTGRGHSDSTLADACMSRLNCPFARYLLDSILSGKLDFLDGAIGYNSCDHVRRMFDNWRLRHEPDFYHFLSIPHRTDELALNWFKKEITNLKEHIESHYKITLTVSNAAGGNTITKTSYIKVTTNTRPGIYSESK